VSRLSDHLDELKSFVDDLPQEQLWERPAADRWSMGEIVVHLIEKQDNHIEWITRMIVEDNPKLDEVQPDQHAANPVESELLRHRLKDFCDQRITLISLLNALDDVQWHREAIHPSIKHFSVEKCMEGLMRHEEYHLYDVFKIFFDVNGEG